MICTLLGLLYAIVGFVQAFDLTLLHTNDVHSHFMPTTAGGGRCTADDATTVGCFGGAARRAALVRRLRKQYTNVMLVDAGDQFQGTAWYSVLKWEPIAVTMNAIGYDAMSFGNHEFDDGVDGLVPFVKNLTFPVLGANVDASGTPLAGLYRSSHIVNVGGERVGIIGYVTPETAVLSNPGPGVRFTDELVALREAVRLLETQGVKIIIAVGHSGITMDRAICKNVAGIDIVVGGHTNTFLYHRSAESPIPSTEEPEGDYPEVTQRSDSRCLNVQDYAFGKYLGFLKVQFDSAGRVESWKGSNPLLLDSRVYPDEDVGLRDRLARFDDRMQTIAKQIVGYTSVAIDGSRKACRLLECNLGNIVADAMVWFSAQSYAQSLRHVTSNSSITWTRAAIAISNGGGSRDFESVAQRNVTFEDILTVLPFGNTLQTVRMKGRTLLDAFEYAVQDYSTAAAHGKFLQVSGVRIVYDLAKPNGRRVVSVRVLCGDCAMPRYEPLDVAKAYDVMVPDYILQGGDGYQFGKGVLAGDNAATLVVDVVVDYLKMRRPIMTGIEERILFVNERGERVSQPPIVTAGSRSVMANWIVLIVGIILWRQRSLSL